jgi:hypothetical protein
LGFFPNQEIGPLDGKKNPVYIFSYLLAKIKGGENYQVADLFLPNVFNFEYIYIYIYIYMMFLIDVYNNPIIK